MRIPKLSRRGKTVRNLLVTALALLIAWGANGFGSLTLEGAIERAAAQYFGEPGTIVVVEKAVFDEDSSADAVVLTDRGDGYLHAYTISREWMWLYQAAYKGAFPVESDECTIAFNRWKEDALQYNEYQYTINGRPVTVWIERFD